MKAFFSAKPRGCGRWQGGWGERWRPKSIRFLQERGVQGAQGSAADGPSHGGEWTVSRGKLWRKKQGWRILHNMHLHHVFPLHAYICHQLSLHKARGRSTEEQGGGGAGAAGSSGPCPLWVPTALLVFQFEEHTDQAPCCKEQQRDASDLEKKRGA